MIIANKVMVDNVCGIITVLEKDIIDLINYY